MKSWKCSVCGQVFEGEHPPIPCPVCGAGEDAFVSLHAAGSNRWKCTVCGQIFDGAAPPVPCPVCGASRDAFEQVQEQKQEFSRDTADDFVLVGGGAAALAAAKAIRQRNKSATITIVCDEPHLPYNRPALSDVLADGLSLPNVALEQPEYYAQQGINALVGVSVQSIDPNKKNLLLSDGSTLPYTKLLLATGSRPFNPIASVSGAIPVHTLRVYEDAIAIGEAAKGKTAVVVGGGILGLEAALALRERGCSVTIVELAPRLLSLQADDEVSTKIQQHVQAMGIRVLTKVSVTAPSVGVAVLSNGEELQADFIVASMGVRSNVDLAQSLGLQLGRGIVVDEQMRTSMANVWAAGDCAEFEGKVQALFGSAIGMGAVAGACMTEDTKVRYTGFTPSLALSIRDFSLLSVGNISDTPEMLVYNNSETNVYKKLVFEKGKLRGALFVGSAPAAKVVGMVAEKAPLSQAVTLLGG